MHKKILYTAVLTAVMSAPQVSAAKIELSEAFEYNAFIFDSFTGQSSDVEGRLAVGGEMNVSDFNVGLLLSPDMSESALAVGGNLHFTRGDVHGGSTTVSGMVFGSELTFDKAVNAQQTVNLINSTVKSGGISSKGDVKLGNSNVVSGDVHANTVKLGGPNSVYDSVSNPTLYGSQVENGNVFAESSVELDSSEVNGTVTLNDVNNYTAINGSTATSVERGSVSKADVNNIDFNAIAAEVRSLRQCRSMAQQYGRALTLTIRAKRLLVLTLVGLALLIKALFTISQPPATTPSMCTVNQLSYLTLASLIRPLRRKNC